MRRRSLIALPALLLLPRAAATAPAPIKLRELYNRDFSFSDLALGLEGQPIVVSGYMAPPLKADSTFFVMTMRPMATCPFCETEAQWPDDILAVYTRRVYDVIPFNVPIEVSGTLNLTTYTDPETGFVSRVQVTEARVSRA